MSPAELARAVKVKPPSVSDWLSGETKTIKGENLLRAAQALQCTPQWLATGLGPMALDPAQRFQQPQPAREETVSYITDKLIEEAVSILQFLDPPSRREALQWLRGFAAGRKSGQDSNGDHHPLSGGGAF